MIKNKNYRWLTSLVIIREFLVNYNNYIEAVRDENK